MNNIIEWLEKILSQSISNRAFMGNEIDIDEEGEHALATAVDIIRERERMVATLEQQRKIIMALFKDLEPVRIVELAEAHEFDITDYVNPDRTMFWHYATPQAREEATFMLFREDGCSEGYACQMLGIDRLTWREQYYEWLDMQGLLGEDGER